MIRNLILQHTHKNCTCHLMMHDWASTDDIWHIMYAHMLCFFVCRTAVTFRNLLTSKQCSACLLDQSHNKSSHRTFSSSCGLQGRWSGILQLKWFTALKPPTQIINTINHMLALQNPIVLPLWDEGLSGRIRLRLSWHCTTQLPWNSEYQINNTNIVKQIDGKI